MGDSSRRIPIGRIVGSFGIRGQVKVDAETTFVQRFDKGRIVYLDGEALKIQSSQLHKGHFILGFKEIPDKTTADRLQWKSLETDQEELPELAQDEFLTKDLIGLMVLTEEGRPLGKVDQVLPYPAHDILVVGKVLIPAVKEFVKDIDLENKRISVRLLEGMEDE